MRINPINLNNQQNKYFNFVKSKNEVYSKVDNLPQMYYPVSFGYGAKIKEEYLSHGDLSCPCCGEKMLSSKVYNSVNSVLNGGKYSNERECVKGIVDFVQPHEDKLHPVQRYVFDSLKEAKKVNPNLSMEKFVLQMYKEADENLDYQTTDFLSKVAKKMNKTNLLGGAREFARKLLLPSLITVEHIKPESTAGVSGMANYLFDCFDCNNQRGNISFDRFVRQSPKMSENMQKYFDRIILLINEGKIKDYDYPIIMKEVLFEQSKGLIKIDISRLK